MSDKKPTDPSNTLTPGLKLLGEAMSGVLQTQADNAVPRSIWREFDALCDDIDAATLDSVRPPKPEEKTDD